MSISKYKNVLTSYGGIMFHSKKEADYAKTLDILHNASKLSDRVASYQLQVPFVIYSNGKKICTYRADFVVTFADGHTEVVDVKGFRTQIYKLKKALVEAQYSVEIKEV